MTNSEKAAKLTGAARLLDGAASAYRDGRVATGQEKVAQAWNDIADVATGEGWKVDVELPEPPDVADGQVADIEAHQARYPEGPR